MANLSDIVLEEKKGLVLSNYKDPVEIGANILNDFVKLYKKSVGFPLDTDTNKVGLISNCMALSTILEIESLGTPINKHLNMLFDLVEIVFDELYGDDDRPCFSAEPYFKADGLDSYVESASKILITMTDLRTFLLENKDALGGKISIHIRNNEVNTVDELVAQVQRLMVQSIKSLNNSCIKNEDPIDYKINGNVVKRENSFPKDTITSSITSRGWSYANIGQENSSFYGTSLYFTYHATNAFISFYKCFELQFQKKYENATINESNMMPKEKNMLKLNDSFFNDNEDIIDTFRTKTIHSGRYIERKMISNGVDLALDYVDKELKPVTIDAILNSQKSNDVINTTLVMAILINAGVDDDYKIVGQKEYFYEQIQFGINNVKKAYSLLKKASREDAVDTYRLLFDESCPKDMRSSFQEYRLKCADVYVYDFVPLFCNTYSIISKYLICYPQKEMKENLGLVMENQMDKEWLWTKSGFDINNNLYYIFAIENFYEYYNEYELPLSDNGQKYNIEAEKAKAELKESRNEQSRLVEELKIWQDKYEAKKSIIDQEVYRIATEMFGDKINEAIEKYIDEMIKDGKNYALYVQAEKLNNSTFSPSKELYKKFTKAELLHKIVFANRFAKVAERMGDSAKTSNEGYKNRQFDALLEEIIFDENN